MKKTGLAKGLAAAVCLILICQTAFASILGEELYADALVFGDGVVYNDNLFYSNQSGVGYQNEHYFTYTPNPNVVPVITNGESVYGRRTLTQMTSYLQEQGMTPIMGMNADYFSFQTGVPMGHTITEGEILTKSEEGQDAIAFRKDGTAFLSWLEIKTELKTATQTIPIANINKYRLASRIYMMTEDYYSDTRASGWGIDVVIGSLEGKLAIGQSVTGVVEEIGYHDGSVPIPKGKYVISLHMDGDQELFRQLEALQIGEQVTISNWAVNCPDGLWETAEYATGSVGGRLIENGKLTGIDGTAAPRTAVGIKADGSVLFYTIDGRQNSSYGVRLTTLAKRMLELGCVEALNMDGGGSTCVNGVFPGNTQSALLNSPSDGTLRSVCNFFALINTRQPDGAVAKLHLYPYGGIYLAGASEQFTVKATDGSGYAVDPPTELSFTAEGPGSSYVGENWVKFGTGDTTVTVTGGQASDTRSYRVVQTPDEITVYGEISGDKITSLSVSAGAQAPLTARARHHYQDVSGDDTCFTWKMAEGSEELGSIDGSGTFTAGEYSGSGAIVVSAGERSVSIPVTVQGSEFEDSFMDVTLTVEGTKVTGRMEPVRGVELDWMSLTVDRKEVPVELAADHRSFEYELEDGGYHKLTLKVGKGNQYAALATAEAGNSETLGNAFSDMAGHWAAKPVNYLYAQGMISGYSENGGLRFDPERQMTRAEFAVLLAKLKGLQPYEASVGLADEAQLPGWAAPSIRAAVKAGLMSGRAEGNKLVFDPGAPITRTEVCSVLARTLTGGYPKASLTAKDAGQIPAWGLDAFRQMAALGVISGYQDGSLLPNRSVSRAEAAQMLFVLY